MEMSCGKTITSIAIAGILHEHRHIKKILITAPLSILGVWEQEFTRFADFPYQLTVLKGNSSQKKEQLFKLHGDWKKSCLLLMPISPSVMKPIKSRKIVLPSPKQCII